MKKSVQIQNNRNRPFVCCMICKQFFNDAVKIARNGVALANRVRAAGVEKLLQIIDYLDSTPHKVAADAKKTAEL